MLQRQSWPWKSLTLLQRQKLVDIIAKTELAMEFPEEFKTLEIPGAFKDYAANAMKAECSISTEAAGKLLDELDPRMLLKLSLKHFQQADQDNTGVLNLEHYVHFCELEIQSFSELTGCRIHFPEQLLVEGFACTQFEGKDGITFTDMQIAEHMAGRICLEILDQGKCPFENSTSWSCRTWSPEGSAMAGDCELVKLKFSEGDIFMVEPEMAYMSVLITGMIADSGTDEEIPLPNVKTAVLSKVLDYCQYHKGNPADAIQKPLKSRNLMECGISEWDCEYVDIEQEMIFHIILAANYLDIKSLLDLACAKIASMIKGRTVKEIRAQFDINDFTPEEEAQIREENFWHEDQTDL